MAWSRTWSRIGLSRYMHGDRGVEAGERLLGDDSVTIRRRGLDSRWTMRCRLAVVQRNVSDLTRPPRKATREMRTLSPAEVRRFLSVVQGDRFEALYVLALTAGMRQGELLDHAFLSVRMNVQEADGRFILAGPTRGRASASFPPLWRHSSSTRTARRRRAGASATPMTPASIWSFPIAWAA